MELDENDRGGYVRRSHCEDEDEVGVVDAVGDGDGRCKRMKT